MSGKNWKEELKKDWAFAGFRGPKDLKKPAYRHALLLGIMLILIGLFFLSELLAQDRYYVVHCPLDDLIPFNEYFILFYVTWFPFWIFMLLYTMCFEVPTYKRLIRFFVLTYGISLSIFLIFPTGVEMRPAAFPRNNFCTWLVQLIYNADKSVSVFPSEHVIGAFAVVFAAADTKRFSGAKSMAVITFIAIMISISITFVKQHSALDILGALPVIVLGYYVCFYPEQKRRKAVARSSGKLSEMASMDESAGSTL